MATLGLLTTAQAEVTTPEKFFGFQLGSDRKMARWDRIVEYFGLLEKEGAGRMKVVNMGPSEGRLARGLGGYFLDGRWNDSFRAVNLLVDKGVAVRRIDKAAEGLRPGDFVVSAGPEAELSRISKETGVDFLPVNGNAGQTSHEVKRARIGMYQRYRGGNMDEGWTRLLLEQFNYPYTSLKDAEIKKGGLIDRFDTIILPDDSTGAITGERSEPRGAQRPPETYPPEYRSGIGDDGVKSLLEFVQKGGTLVTLGAASGFAIEKLGVTLRNVVANVSPKEFFCPGSTLRVKFDNANPLAYGMPEDGLAVFLSGNLVFEIAPTGKNDDYQVLARYADRDLLESGWLIGEKRIAGQAAAVAAKLGAGRVVLIGFRTQHRAQTHGTFKLLFNALTQ
ncbi:MAG: hypothetical protein ACRD44_10130 [Bryobacteraceae bacterium]